MIFTFIFFVNVSYRKERSFLFKRFLYVPKEKVYFRASFVPLFLNFCCVSKIQRFMKVCHHAMLVSWSHCVTRNRISRGNFSLYNDIPLSFPSLDTRTFFTATVHRFLLWMKILRYLWKCVAHHGSLRYMYNEVSFFS